MQPTADHQSLISSQQQHLLNQRRRPSLLQSNYSDYGGFNAPLHLSYMNSLPDRFRDNSYLTNRTKPLLLNTLNTLSMNNGPLGLPPNLQLPNAHLLATAPVLSQATTPSPLHQFEDYNASANRRPRLFPDNKASLQPLLIETNSMMDMKKEHSYTPQVEAISPTPNEDSRQESSPVKTTKDDILHNINQIDREITQGENQMSKLKKRQQELEALTNKSSGSASENIELSGQHSTTQIIYSENRKKSKQIQLMLEKLGPRFLLPIYNQPSDTPIYHQNRKKFETFKSMLVLHFKRKFIKRRRRETYLTETYDRLMQEWLKSIEMKDFNPITMKKSKENKMRDFFERHFPDLKRQREEKERLCRAGQRVRSDADLEDIMDGIQEQELEDKKIRAYAVIPPILHDPSDRVYKFITNNCKIEDPVADHKELQQHNIWTDAEKEIFKEKFLQAPKNFGLIASFLERKSVMDCVHYYYTSKKRENYKQLLQKNAKKRTRALAKQQAQQQQAAQQQAAQQAAAAQQQQLEQQRLAQQRKGIDTAGREERDVTAPKEEQQQQQHAEQPQAVATAAIPGESNNVIAAVPATTTTPVPEDEQRSITPKVECALCSGTIGENDRYYVLTVANCFLYSVSPDDVRPQAKICKKCKIKCSMGPCPVTGCKSSDKPNRMLRALPRQWFELTPDLRYTYSAELNFPLDCKRCCSRCWLRLVRKCSGSFRQHELLRKLLDVNWTDQDVMSLKDAIRKHGRNWTAVSNAMHPVKTVKQCRDFYFFFKYELRLNSLTFLSKPDSDSDSYWSNQIASEEDSSEDEYANSNSSSSQLGTDGLNANKRLSSSQLSLKSDCDSSATMSADEGQGGADGDARCSPAAATKRSDSFDSGRYLDNLLVQQKQRIPSFLINPNAPTVQNSAAHRLSIRQGSPATPIGSITSGMPITPVGLPANGLSNLNPAALAPLNAAGLSNPAALPPNLQSTAAAAAASGNKEKPTCVRDLIYQAIEISLKSPVKSASKQDQVASTAPQLVPPQLNEKQQQLLPEIKKEYLHQKAVPERGDQRPEGLAMMAPFVLPATHSAYPLHFGLPSEMVDNEVQDLSKKVKKEFKDEEEPKNYSIPKASNFVAGFHHMPPPAHQLSSRTSTPGLEQTVTNAADAMLYMRESPRGPHASATPPPRRAPSVGPKQPPPLITTAKPVQVPSSYSPKPPLQQQQASKQMLHGSITQGTPMHASNARLARDGSITLGTPLPDNKRKMEDPMEQFYKRASPSNFSSHTPPTSFAPASASRNSSQLIIDFNTSKQMHRRNDKEVKPQQPASLFNNFQLPLSGQPSFMSQLPNELTADPNLLEQIFAAQRSALQQHQQQQHQQHQQQQQQHQQHQQQQQLHQQHQQQHLGKGPQHVSHAQQQQQQLLGNHFPKLTSVTQSQQPPHLTAHASVSQSPLVLQPPTTAAQAKLLLNTANFPPTHDAFQALVNAAAAEKRLVVPQEQQQPNASPHLTNSAAAGTLDLSVRASNRKDDHNRSEEVKHSALKLTRDPLSKEQFEKEFKQQPELSRFQPNFEASRIITDSFQKDNKIGNSRQTYTASSLIDAIITKSINNDPTRGRSQPSSNDTPDRDKSKTNIATSSTMAAESSIDTEKLRKALEQKKEDSQATAASASTSVNTANNVNNKQPQNVVSSVELEPVSPAAAQSSTTISQQSTSCTTTATSTTTTSSSASCAFTESVVQTPPTSEGSRALNSSLTPFDYVHSRIVEVMSEENEESPKKKMRLDEPPKEAPKQLSTKLPPSSLECVTSLSELKAQKEKQQQLKQQQQKQQQISESNAAVAELTGITNASTNTGPTINTNNMYEPLSDDESS